MRRVVLFGVTCLMVAAAAGRSTLAADLPSMGGFGPPRSGSFGAPPQPGLLTNPFQGTFYTEPRRFDAYGNPVYGPLFSAAPNPLYASTGCPQVLQPVYDNLGNFAGYSPIPACR